MTTPNIEERVSRLEGGYAHLATKADLAELETRMLTVLSATEGRFHSSLASTQADTNRRIDRVFWAVIGIGGGLLAVAVAALLRSVF